jgi:hypothetical protein
VVSIGFTRTQKRIALPQKAVACREDKIDVTNEPPKGGDRAGDSNEADKTDRKMRPP